MPDCDYCNETFADEDSYLQHLADTHETGELSRIDQRRVEEATDGGDESSLPTGPLILGGLVVVSLAATVWVTFFFGGGSGAPSGNGLTAVEQTPTGQRTAHSHGTMEVTIAGDQLDFSREEFQLQDNAFHFEDGNGRIWHAHAQGVTLEYALETLGISANRTAVRYDGTTYRNSDPGTTVSFTVDGEEVDPTSHVLDGVSDPANVEQGDSVRVVVRTDG